MPAMYLDNRKAGVEEKDKEFFEGLGLTSEIQDLANFKQATGLQHMYWRNGKSLVKAMVDKSAIEDFKKIGGVLTIEELRVKKAKKKEE